MSTGTAIGFVLALVAVTAAVGAVFAKEVLRLALALGVLLMTVAGVFLLYGAVFPAVAEVFLYVGGVLVLLLFALMLLRRDSSGHPQLPSRHSASAALISLGVFAALTWGFWPMTSWSGPTLTIPIERIAAALLGRYFAVFELLAVLLLVALVAAVALTADRGAVTQEEPEPAAEPLPSAPETSAAAATSPALAEEAGA